MVYFAKFASLFLSTLACVYREKDLYVSGREIKDLIRAAGPDTTWVFLSSAYDFYIMLCVVERRKCFKLSYYQGK